MVKVEKKGGELETPEQSYTDCEWQGNRLIIKGEGEKGRKAMEIGCNTDKRGKNLNPAFRVNSPTSIIDTWMGEKGTPWHAFITKNV